MEKPWSRDLIGEWDGRFWTTSYGVVPELSVWKGETKWKRARENSSKFSIRAAVWSIVFPVRIEGVLGFIPRWDILLISKETLRMNSLWRKDKKWTRKSIDRAQPSNASFSRIKGEKSGWSSRNSFFFFLTWSWSMRDELGDEGWLVKDEEERTFKLARTLLKVLEIVLINIRKVCWKLVWVQKDFWEKMHKAHLLLKKKGKVEPSKRMNLWHGIFIKGRVGLRSFQPHQKLYWIPLQKRGWERVLNKDHDHHRIRKLLDRKEDWKGGSKGFKSSPIFRLFKANFPVRRKNGKGGAFSAIGGGELPVFLLKFVKTLLRLALLN